MLSFSPLVHGRKAHGIPPLQPATDRQSTAAARLEGSQAAGSPARSRAPRAHRRGRLPQALARGGYPSLFQYLVEELGFREDAAYNRIQAARTARAHPGSRMHKEGGAACHRGEAARTPPHTGEPRRAPGASEARDQTPDRRAGGGSRPAARCGASRAQSARAQSAKGAPRGACDGAGLSLRLGEPCSSPGTPCRCGPPSSLLYPPARAAGTRAGPVHSGSRVRRDAARGSSALAAPGSRWRPRPDPRARPLPAAQRLQAQEVRADAASRSRAAAGAGKASAERGIFSSTSTGIPGRSTAHTDRNACGCCVGRTTCSPQRASSGVLVNEEIGTEPADSRRHSSH